MTLSTTILWALVVIAATWDVWKRKIPNALILAGLILGLAFQFQAGGMDAVTTGIGAAGLALVLLIGPFALHVMGGGDVKLAMVCGAFTDWKTILEIILVGTVIHGVLALLTLLARRIARARGTQLPDRAQVPHAVGFAVATIIITAGFLHFM